MRSQNSTEMDGKHANGLPNGLQKSTQNLTSSQPIEENAASQPEGEIRMQDARLNQTIFADKQFPSDWHVEAIDPNSGDIFVAVFSGPDAEQRAREYADWQRLRLTESERLRTPSAA